MDYSKYCVISSHGFTGYPEEMNPLGEYLREAGFSWKNLQLPGHGTTPEDLREVTWHDWTDYVDSAVKQCLAEYNGVFFTGLSLGGLITLYALEHHSELLGGATLSAPVFIFTFWQSLLTHLPVSFWVKRSETDLRDIRDVSQRSHHRAYSTFHTDSARQLDSFAQYVRARLADIRQPLLVVHSTEDRSIPFSNAHTIYDAVSSERKEQLLVHNSGHVLTRDYDREEIFSRIASFFKSVLQ